MDSIYLPETITSNQCAYVYDKDTIRVYESRPNYNTDINYTDYFINSNYIYREGTTRFNQYSSLPSCLDSSLFTDEVYYRNDFDKILIIFFIIFIFAIYFPYRIICRLFGRWLKV